ncbi:MAG: TIGR03936 family radical SAM-associated protein [Anaerocolumna aminovalerica]|uniref:TIGR03936 family radical SAM-associated protein n=1 Tax=Anaerocolumna aminovalerica TaxID=1527 RepID=UPI000BE24033|nr:TIGR03936 family radical SAM-associated protein [Anaerocolumna aminovalerica]MBU5330668.1 TIGR03936 family radical SAM-associated protein [Anaerocolumna aminovalerica]MDU6264406.1 TIGR03936 family radical SAM-associated protein [Anaerocolumna aminovalerica]
MKTRIKFTKSGSLKFVGHLDVMRYFQKAFRRAELEVEYSQGFNPHQLMSFAAPLGVGLTSDGEYLDLQLKACDEPEVMIEKINKTMAEEIQAVGFMVLPEDSKNAMSIVAAADYMVSVKDGYEFMEMKEFMKKFQEFHNRESIVILKKSKKSEKEVDIKPSIYHIGFEREEFCKNIGQIYDKDMKSVADEYENGIKVYMQLATGSANNLKPELVMEAFCQYTGIEYNEFAFQVHRMEVYADLGTEENRRLIALDQMND